jgi:hypothetical protein
MCVHRRINRGMNDPWNKGPCEQGSLGTKGLGTIGPWAHRRMPWPTNRTNMRIERHQSPMQLFLTGCLEEQRRHTMAMQQLFISRAASSGEDSVQAEHPSGDADNFFFTKLFKNVCLYCYACQ